MPGVQSAAVGTVVPLGQQGQPFLNAFEIQGRSSVGRDRPAADVNVVSTRYFETLGIPIIGGRDFRETDTKRIGAGGGDQPVDGPLLGWRGSRRLARLLRQRRALVHRRRRHRHRAAVRARARWRRAAVHRAQPVAVPGGRQPAPPHDRRSRLDDGGRARHRPLAGPGHAGGARPDARGPANQLPGADAPDGHAPRALCRRRARRDARRAHRRHRHVGVAAHAGVRRADGARGATGQHPDGRRAPGPGDGRHRPRDRRRRVDVRRPVLHVVSLRHAADRSRDVRRSWRLRCSRPRPWRAQDPRAARRAWIRSSR